jgi:UDP-N-acetylmuramoyl-tripeptide--D-alanyl-D-alanine ligase
VREAFWTIERIGHALSELLVGEAPRGLRAIRRISTDTRAIREGDCFVALVGERFDGHDFVDQAIASGAVAVVASKPGVAPPAVPTFVVSDTLVALGALGRFRRLAWGGPVVAIGGSNGKTSTKALVSGALATRLRVHATTGNLNNRIGVPLTLLALPFDADVAVVEVGTSIPGEIATLREIVRPDIAIVTSIAEEHLEGFGDLAGVLREESAIFPGTTVAIVPSSEPALAESAQVARRVVRAGLDEGDVHAEAWRLEPDGTGTAYVGGATVRSPLRGAHNLRNLMLALAAARELGVSYEEMAAGVAALEPPPMRANWQQIGRALVINDAYNSNPGSAIAAIDMLTAAPGPQKVAVLGTMRELGANSARCHDDVVRAALAAPVDIVAGVGEFADALARTGVHDGRVVTVPDVDDLWAALEPRLQPDATILLKASRGVKLERILPSLTSWAERAC